MKGNGADGHKSQSEWVNKLIEEKGKLIHEHIHKSGTFMMLLQELAKEYCGEIPDLDAKRLREAEVHVSAMAYCQLVNFSLSPGDYQARAIAAEAMLMDLAEMQGRDPRSRPTGDDEEKDKPRIITDPDEINKMGGGETC